MQAAPCSDVLDLSSEAGPILGNHTESRFGVFVITVGLTGEIHRINRTKTLAQSLSAFRAAMLVIFLLSKRTPLGFGVTDIMDIIDILIVLCFVT